jgi:hypothetical protein
MMVKDLNYKVVFSFMREWLKFEETDNLSEMEFVHFAVKNKAPFEVVQYLCELFPSSVGSKGKHDGYTPLMHALEGEKDLRTIKCVSTMNIEYLGDYDPERNYFNAHSLAVEKYMGGEEWVDTNMTMFRLENNDPTLTTLIIGDTFYDMERYEEKSIEDILHAVYEHDHLRELIFAVDRRGGDIWYTGDGGGFSALVDILSHKTSIQYILFRTSEYFLVKISELLSHCPQLKRLHIHYDGWGTCTTQGF